MAANPKQALHEMVERLSDEEARRLSATLRQGGGVDIAARPRPLTEDDVLLAEPVLPDDETADEMIEFDPGARFEWFLD